MPLRLTSLTVYLGTCSLGSPFHLATRTVDRDIQIILECSYQKQVLSRCALNHRMKTRQITSIKSSKHALHVEHYLVYPMRFLFIILDFVHRLPVLKTTHRRPRLD